MEMLYIITGVFLVWCLNNVRQTLDAISLKLTSVKGNLEGINQGLQTIKEDIRLYRPVVPPQEMVKRFKEKEEFEQECKRMEKKEEISENN